MTKETEKEIEEIINDGFTYYLGERKDVCFDDKPLLEYCLPRIKNLLAYYIQEGKQAGQDRIIGLIEKTITLKEKDCEEIGRDLRKIVGEETPITEEEICSGFELRKSAIKEIKKLKQDLLTTLKQR